MTNTVLIQGNPVVQEEISAEVITPANLLAYDASGNVVKHAVSGGTSNPIVAKENDSKADCMDSNYQSGETITCLFPRKGDVVAMILATAQTILKGDPLESNGDGTVKKQTTFLVAGSRVGTADEAITTTGATALIKVRT